jgi:hypothetical protein
MRSAKLVVAAFYNLRKRVDALNPTLSGRFTYLQGKAVELSTRQPSSA